jgi:hypothetical protein
MNYTRTNLLCTTNAEKALSALFKSLTDRLDSPQAALTIGETVPLFEAVIRLAGNLEESIAAQGRRIVICEATLFSSKGSTRPKIVKPHKSRPTIDGETASDTYRVTFAVQVTNAKLLLERARDQKENYAPEEGIETIEEALCWVLPGGDDDAECFDILDSDAEAVVIAEATRS